MLFTEMTLEEYGDLREEDGVEKGIEKGVERGIKQAKLENARKMKADSLPDELIAKYTALPLETVKNL